MNSKTVKKRTFLLGKLAACLLTILVIALYFPVYAQPGVHTLDGGFLSLTEDGQYTGSAGTISLDGSTLSFDNGLSPLTVTVEDGFYTVMQQEEVLYTGRMPEDSDDRKILEDGTIVAVTDSSDGYPLLLSQIISLSQGQNEIRGDRRHMTAGIAGLLIWIADILFPNLFYRVDPRSIGGRGAPSATYRKIQRVMRIILPLWALVFLTLSLL